MIAQQPQTEVGIIDGMPFDRYAAIPAVNSTLLKNVNTSLAHAKAVSDGKREYESRSLDVGLVCHAAIEPDGIAAFRRFDGDRRTKAGKSEWEDIQAAGLTAVRGDDYDTGLACAEALRSNPVVARILSNPKLPGKHERTMIWQHRSGLLCKARCDWMSDNGLIILDVKTARDASEHAFRKQAASLLYHVQAAHYIDGAHALLGGAAIYVWAVVETTYPHAVGIYQLNRDQIEPSRKMRDRLLSRWSNAVAAGMFPGYVSGWPPPEITMPDWAIAPGEEVSDE